MISLSHLDPSYPGALTDPTKKVAQVVKTRPPLYDSLTHIDAAATGDYLIHMDELTALQV